ncbi:MAG: flavin reductase family protein [Cumulibacter sp.]
MCFSCSSFSDARSGDVKAAHVQSIFRRAAASTWVVAGLGERGPIGLTLTSLVSVSTTPAIVSFNMPADSAALAVLREHRWAAAHLLDASQGAIAAEFRRSGSSAIDRNDDWRYDDRGLPNLNGACARLVLSIRDFFDAGESVVALADVRDGAIGSSRPLLHHRGGFVAALA